MITAKRVYEWGKAGVLIMTILWTGFTVASGAISKLNAVPKLAADIEKHSARIAEISGKLDFIVAYIENRSGRKYHDGEHRDAR